MEQPAAEHADSATFFNVWVREAHAGGNYPQPESVEQREQCARAFCDHQHPSSGVVMDDLEGTLHKLFGSMPNAVYALDARGRVAYRANWLDSREVRRVLERLTGSEERRVKGSTRACRDSARKFCGRSRMTPGPT